LAFCNISGLKFAPITDSAGTVVGTSLVFVSESDFGGSVPKWITQKFAPSALNDFMEETVANIRKKKLIPA
jgi:hypothetical protein